MPGSEPPARRTARRRDPVDEATRHWGQRYEDAPRFRALTSLVRTYGTAVRAIEALLRPLGLTFSRFEILLVLSFARSGALPIMRLRDVLMVHGSSVTYLVDRLEAAGLVARASQPADRRVSLVKITDAGRDCVERASRLLADRGFGPFAALDEDRLEDLSDLLGALRANGVPEPAAQEAAAAGGGLAVDVPST
jgi:DNA-binding MarR family transcriptional regulator